MIYFTLSRCVFLDMCARKELSLRKSWAISTLEKAELLSAATSGRWWAVLLTAMGKMNMILIIKLPLSQLMPFSVPHCSRASSGCRTGLHSTSPSCSIIPESALDLSSSFSGFICLFTFHYAHCSPYFEVSRWLTDLPNLFLCMTEETWVNQWAMNFYFYFAAVIRQWSVRCQSSTILMRLAGN